MQLSSHLLLSMLVAEEDRVSVPLLGLLLSILDRA